MLLTAEEVFVPFLCKRVAFLRGRGEAKTFPHPGFFSVLSRFVLLFSFFLSFLLSSLPPPKKKKKNKKNKKKKYPNPKPNTFIPVLGVKMSRV